MSEQNPVVPPAPPEPSAVTPPTPPAPPVPQYGEYAASVPRYGEYAPGHGAPTSVPPGGAVGPSGATVRPRRTWDLVLTVILLVLGLLGMGLGVVYGLIFIDPNADTILSEGLAAQGRGGWHGTVGAAGPIIIATHVILYVIVLALTIPLLIRGRIVVFWIPLTAGIVAAIIFWGALAAVVLSDPSFVSSFKA